MFRRSGSFVSFFVAGQMPAPHSEEFLAALSEHRFRDIAMAASEETSTGWVTPKDPTGETFDADAMELGGSIWLRFRTDRKKLPAVWMNIHRATAEQSAGRKLSAKERKDLKEDLMQQLLPKVLPTVALIDAIFQPRAKKVVLFGTAVAAKDAFRKLMFESFGVELVPADAFERAARSGLGTDMLGKLGSLEPVRWRREQDGSADRRDRAEQGDHDSFGVEVSA